ncbi:hypothetical protein TorRG33x02_044210 [Trema orientale]|uniref:Transmembrane protein n=1 Tax=Trema orientale TaxID=63057 RepID=A0A2P5FPG0_TREOI|nr:hypothetical protein TorRG33x02_044210 [Trema orientale]
MTGSKASSAMITATMIVTMLLMSSVFTIPVVDAAVMTTDPNHWHIILMSKQSSDECKIPLKIRRVLISKQSNDDESELYPRGRYWNPPRGRWTRPHFPKRPAPASPPPLAAP